MPLSELALARQGVPGRRVGGGTRCSAPRPAASVLPQDKLRTLSFASRNNLPKSLQLKVIFS